MTSTLFSFFNHPTVRHLPMKVADRNQPAKRIASSHTGKGPLQHPSRKKDVSNMRLPHQNLLSSWHERPGGGIQPAVAVVCVGRRSFSNGDWRLRSSASKMPRVSHCQESRGGSESPCEQWARISKRGETQVSGAAMAARVRAGCGQGYCSPALLVVRDGQLHENF